MRPHLPAPRLVARLFPGLLPGLATMLALSLGACSSSSGDSDTEGEPAATTESGVFADLAVCPRDEAGDSGCPLDQSDAPLDVSDVLCSTAYSGDSDSVSISLEYEGGEVFTRDLTGVRDQLGSQDSLPVTGFFGTGTLTIPGGSYTCTFDDGTEQASLDFESPGEPGPAAYNWTCDELDTETEDNSTYCTQDVDTLTGVDAFTCSTVLTGVIGQPVEVLLSVTDSSIDSEATVELTGDAPLGILVAHATLNGEQLLGQPGAQVPAGSYRCEWLVGGEPVDAADLEVTG